MNEIIMKLTENELNELKYHYVDRVVDNMSTKDLIQYVIDDMNRYVDTQFEQDFLDDCQNYWEEHFDDYESDYGEYNEVIDDVEEEVFADTQLSLEGVLA